mmetsp:Transcript_5912/g.20386  ORF Transcript_5912/g.20386 Transcript_5912/m.20386 type:complete len:193 (-) Transcript_5912:246-824(-)
MRKRAQGKTETRSVVKGEEPTQEEGASMASKVFDACVVAQSVVQGAIEPSRLWRSSNSRKLRYEVMGSPEEVTNRIAAAVSSLDNVCPNLISGNPMRFRLSKHKNGKCVSMLVRTPYWLDKATFEVRAVGEDKCDLVAFSRSTGVLPIVIPFSFVLNCLFFFVPFTDGLGKMSKYIIKQVVEESALHATLVR